MNYESMTPEEFKDIQSYLGLSDTELAAVLGIKNPQHIRRLKGPREAGYARELSPWHVRLLRAYMEGYRPLDWPGKK